MPASTGDEFYDLRVRAAAAVPPDQRPQDVAAFLEAVELGNAAAALLPLPGRTTHAAAYEEAALAAAAAAARAAAAPQSQAEQDAEAAAVLAYLTISYAALPGQPRPLNHPLFTGKGRARVDAVLGGEAAATMFFEATYQTEDVGRRGARSAAQRTEQLRRDQAATGLPLRLQPDGSLVLTQNVLESELLPAGKPLPRDLRTVARALQLACTLSVTDNMGAGARILRRLEGLFDDPAALAQLGRQLEAAQERRGGAAPRLPSAQQLQQLWLHMCVRAGKPGADEGWEGIEDWCLEAARRLTRLGRDNPRAWQQLAGVRAGMLAPLEAAAAASGALPRGFKQQYTEVTRAYRRGLDAARAAGNCYHTALLAFNLATDGARLKRGTPAEAAALLREGEAAWAAVKKLLPDEWITELRRERAGALAFQDLLEAHERESPQAWSGPIFDRLIDNLNQRFQSAERRRNADPQRGPECSGCGQRALATRACSGCGKARYCSKACQRAHWREHKPRCLAAQAARTSGSGSGAQRVT